MRALITGAARRIGAAIAASLAQDGHEVVIHYHRSQTDAQRLKARIEASGGTAHLFGADLADRTVVEGMIPRCIDQFGTLDLLINNASSFVHDEFLAFDAATWDFHLRPNLEAPIFLARDFARAAINDGAQDRLIVNMLDHKIDAPNPDFFTYTVAKMGLAGATRVMAQALAGRIRVNGIAPGITLISGKQTPAGFERAFATPPLGYSSTPDDIATAIRFLIATPAVNGEILVLDGGESLVQRGRDVAYAADTPP